MKAKHLVVYDYGTGGVWFYFYANSPKEITDKYSALQVVEEEPEFLRDPERRRKMALQFTFDIDDPPSGVLSEMLAAGMGKSGD